MSKHFEIRPGKLNAEKLIDLYHDGCKETTFRVRKFSGQDKWTVITWGGYYDTPEAAGESLVSEYWDESSYDDTPSAPNGELQPIIDYMERDW